MFRHPWIGLTGTNGAGKGEAAAFLAARGYARVSLSDVIRDALREEGLEPSRDNLIAKGKEVRRLHGPDVLARRAAARVGPPAVVDSIRNVGEVAYLRTLRGFFLLALDAPAALRYERVCRRGRDECAPSLEAFERKEAEEMSADPDAQQIHACLALADRILVNAGTLEDLGRALEELL